MSNNIKQQKNLYIIAGPNGAGKTTSAITVLPKFIKCNEYVNADAIANSLSPFKPDSVAIEAGKIMLKRINTLVEKGEDFSFETTLASRSFSKLISRCKQLNYKSTLIYLWLNDVNLAIERVKKRVENGGHFIPTDVIKRRFVRSQINLSKIYIPIVDKFIIYDGSKSIPSIVAENTEKNGIMIHEKATWNLIQEKFK